MNITEFLEARIAEDETLATAAIETVAPDEWENPTETLNQWPANIAFWGSQTPYRVLAECAAKRAIVAEHGRDDDSSADYCETCAVWWKCELGEGPPPVAWPCPTFRALAAVYKDHPDYQQEWAVVG